MPATPQLDQVQQYVTVLLSENASGSYPYHNLTHTREVVAAVRKIGRASNLPAAELEILLIAAWFHDAGFSGTDSNHEAASAALARQYLAGQGMAEEKIARVTDCIAATRLPQSPKTLADKVLCDADLYHLGRKKYFRKADLLRQELSVLVDFHPDEAEWVRQNIHFLKKHRYWTKYGREKLGPGKKKNLKRLQKNLRQLEKERPQAETGVVDSARLPEEVEAEKHKPGRGVETLFRTTSRNHLELSAIADNKANIMISINAIIVSLIVSVLMRKFEEFPNFIVPTIILTTSCLATIVLAIMATRPSVSRGTFHPEDVASTNLLFFGNFYRMDLEAYKRGMKYIISDNDRLYDSMMQDIYLLGKVLGKRYRLIRICYTVFMFGFVVSVLAYAIALVFFPVRD